ncbi:hypothetical protein SAMN06296273_2203 [Nitrosomonas ureae]|uniref:Hemolysin-type calcium-binding repeat-containing protein n=1 Tax=Nitrosomonas ureae TaxID=44577 RepID=A0A285BZN3_9PROT|nr:hypothetical protein [Nitrosomonas ureae]SNX60732.1 hypothetical protein SAMN06296273_2203 [Nitrosomonas ureae]
MAITAEQQTSILEVAIGLFNAAPGKIYMTELANMVDANGGNLSIEQLADFLDDTAVFKDNILVGNVTIEDQANILLNNFGLAADDDPASAGSQAKAFFEGELAAGKGLGEIVIEAINYLNGSPAEEFAATKTLLDNKVLVAKAYSAAGSSQDIAILQTVLSKVTGDAPYTEEDVQQALADSGVPTGNGSGFSLIVGEDSLTGTSGDDVFTALAVQDNTGGVVNSLESIDRLDGGTGTDTLTATLIANAAPSLTSVENIIARFGGAVTLDLANSTGVQAVTVQSSTAAGTVSNIGDAATLGVRNQVQDVTFSGNTATTQNLNLDTVGNFTTPTQNTVTLDTGATTLNLSVNNANAVIATLASVKTLNVAARGTNEIAQGSGAATTTATITGTGSVELQDAFTVLTTLDATGNSGGVTATVDATAVTVNGGSGNDNIVYTEAVGATAAVALGAGDDRFAITAASTAGATVDAGDGNDTFAVTDGAFLDADAQDIYSNFETLEIGDTVTATGGTGTYDMDNLPGLGAVTIGTALAGAVIIDNAVADTTVTINAEEATDLTLGQNLDYVLATATGSSDDVALTLNGLDGDDDGAAGEGQITVDQFTANDIESFTIASNIGGIDPDFENTDYTNTISALIGDAVETLTFSGNANLVVTALTAAEVNTIDASAMTGALTIDASGASGVEFLGGSANDVYTGTADGDTITGNGGGDDIALGAGSVDTLILNAAGDSLLNADLDGHDQITGFGVAGQLDVIDVGIFGFTGQQASALANKGALAASIVDGSTTSITDFFASGGVDRGVAIGTNGGNTYAFIDANKDGNFTSGEDAVVELTGVVGVTLANFGF